MKAEVRVLIRFDTEDILSPGADDAILALAELMTRRGVRATFPITAMKVDTLIERGRKDVLRALVQHQVGFHSTSHSLHPTIAEELAELSGEAAVVRFGEREGAGFQRVAEAFGEAPRVYTQPGGNWTAEAIPALQSWGVGLYYSEQWNGYLDIAGRPMILSGLHHWAAPVAAPKPFLSQLPMLEDESIAMALAAVKEAAAGERLGLVNVVSHPSELVSERFWDVQPFAGGKNRPQADWEPPPARPRQTVERALDSFATWLEALLRGPSEVEFWTADDLVGAFPDRAPALVVSGELQLRLLRLVAGGRLGAVAVGDVTLSAAEALSVALGTVSDVQRGVFPRPLRVVAQAPPWNESETDADRQVAQIAGPVLEEASGQLGRSLATGQLPATVTSQSGNLSPLAVAAGGARAALQLLEGGAWPDRVPLPEVRLLSRRFVKPVEALHWDWPIFAPRWSAPALRRRAEAATWCLKPAEPELADDRL